MARNGNIFLIGFMGAGKSTVGRALAKILGLRFLDMDDAVEREFEMKIAEIFSRFGEQRFRDAESAALKSLSGGQVVATGGGVVLREENWQAMREGGVTVYLEAPAEVLWNRVKANPSRPLLQVEKPFERLVELLSSRAALYEKADIAVSAEGQSPESVAGEIAKKLSEFHHPLLTIAAIFD